MDSADCAVSEEKVRDFTRVAGKVDFVLFCKKTGLNTKKRKNSFGKILQNLVEYAIIFKERKNDSISYRWAYSLY